jgi:galactokinase
MAIVICDSGTKRALATSAYNQRREECRQGVLLIRKRLDGVTALRDVSSADFALLEDTLPEPIRRRCRHVITENERTLAAAAALELRDFVTLGRLMSQSHESLRFDYAVSVGELDLLADTALTVPGVLGSRMTGGGFGGCTITLLEGHAIDSFVDTVRNAFQKQFSRLPRFFLPVPSAGAHEILV